MNFSLKEQDFIKLFCYSSFFPSWESLAEISFSTSTQLTHNFFIAQVTSTFFSLWRAAEPVNCILNDTLQCLAVTDGAHSFPKSCQIRGVRLAIEQNSRAGQRHLKLQNEKQNGSLFPEVHAQRAFFR